jgi:hypothetical protein
MTASTHSTVVHPQSIGKTVPFVIRTHRAPSREEQHLQTLRSLVWLYFCLLIFEGALRKWVAPALSAPLLVVRDPLVLLIYIQALRYRRFPMDGLLFPYFALFGCFVVLAVFQITLSIGGGVLVSLYGLRTNFLHIPLIFVLPRVLSRDDVIKIGKWTLILAVPMTVLMVLQFFSPPNSWLNAATIAEGQQIQSALGRIRPAGTFSFATGVAHFYVLATTFAVYGLLERKAPYPKWLLWAAVISIAVVQPVSGSRLLVLGCGLVLVAALLSGLLNPGRVERLLVMAIVIAAAVEVLLLTSFFREAVVVFTTRWNDASAAAGGVKQGLVWRFLGGFLDPFLLVPEIGLLGKGIGMGTNAASALMTGSFQFLLAEGEWSRVVLEAGPILGFSFLLYRVWLAGVMAFRSLRAVNHQQLLPWLLAWSACRSIITEQLSQPTNLGFMILFSGLCLASMTKDRSQSLSASGLLRYSKSPVQQPLPSF